MSKSFHKDFRGKKEGQRLEFKGRAAIDDLRILPRAVCAMLNAGVGGSIIVGVKDDGVTIEPIDDPELARRRILDRLASSISPSLPRGLEVRPITDAPILLIEVPTNDRGALYAAKSTEGRFLVPKRIDDRIQALEWSEVVSKIIKKQASRGGEENETPEERARKFLRKWIADGESSGVEGAKTTGKFYLLLCAQSEAMPNRWKKVKQALEAALRKPSTIGVRALGVHYSTAAATHSDPRQSEIVRRTDDWLEAGDANTRFRHLQVQPRKEFVLRFVTRMDDLLRWTRESESSRAGPIDPFALSESISSCCDLFAHLMKTLQLNGMVGAGLMLTGTRGLILPPYAPGSIAFDYPEHRAAPQAQDSVTASLELDGGEFRDRPHELARRLLADIYRAFNPDDGDVPLWDATQSRFVYR